MKICFTKSQLTDLWNQANKGIKKISYKGIDIEEQVHRGKKVYFVGGSRNTFESLKQAKEFIEKEL